MESGIQVERQRFVVLGIGIRLTHSIGVVAEVGQEAVGTHQKPGWESACKTGIEGTMLGMTWVVQMRADQLADHT